MASLFETVERGPLKLKNRLVLAPLTRSRAPRYTGVPTDLHTEYYSQRATAGLVIAEATYVEEIGRGFIGQPGIINDEQQAAWAKIADAVHEAGSLMSLQLVHNGRLTLPNMNNGEQAVAPSAIAPAGVTLHGYEGREEVPEPRALETEELARVRDSFVASARRAVVAGMDAVEIHSANGYLLNEFLAPNANQRTDEYGGSPENRARFVIEIVRAVVQEIGAEKTALRISPENNIQGIEETDHADVLATYGALLDGIADLNLAYLSVLHNDIESDTVAMIREKFDGLLILNSGFGHVTELDEVKHIVEAGLADAVAVGREYIANPDLPRRWEEGLELNAPDMATFYTPGAKGYTDYPFAD